MYHVAFIISYSDYRAIMNGGEIVARAIAEKEGFVNPSNFELLDFGSFYRLCCDYEDEVIPREV